MYFFKRIRNRVSVKLSRERGPMAPAPCFSIRFRSQNVQNDRSGANQNFLLLHSLRLKPCFRQLPAGIVDLRCPCGVGNNPLVVVLAADVGLVHKLVCVAKARQHIHIDLRCRHLREPCLDRAEVEREAGEDFAAI